MFVITQVLFGILLKDMYLSWLFSNESNWCRRIKKIKNRNNHEEQDEDAIGNEGKNDKFGAVSATLVTAKENFYIDRNNVFIPMNNVKNYRKS